MQSRARGCDFIRKVFDSEKLICMRNFKNRLTVIQLLPAVAQGSRGGHGVPKAVRVVGAVQGRCYGVVRK